MDATTSSRTKSELRELILAERDMLVRRDGSLTTKAAIIVGIAGVAAPLTQGLPTIFVIPSLAASLFAGVFGVLALLAKQPRLALHEVIGVLSRGGTPEDVDYTPIVEELVDAQLVLAIKRMYIRTAGLVLGLVAALLLNGVIAREFPPSDCELDDTGRTPLRCPLSTYSDARAVGSWTVGVGRGSDQAQRWAVAAAQGLPPQTSSSPANVAHPSPVSVNSMVAPRVSSVSVRS